MLNQNEDHVLVELYRSGNERALEVLIRRHQKRIFLQIYSKVQDQVTCYILTTAVAHPPGGCQLSHVRVDQRHSGCALLPACQGLLVLPPLWCRLQQQDRDGNAGTISTKLASSEHLWGSASGRRTDGFCRPDGWNIFDPCFRAKNQKKSRHVSSNRTQYVDLFSVTVRSNSVRRDWM